MNNVSNKSRSTRCAISDGGDLGRLPSSLIAGPGRKDCRTRVGGYAATDATHTDPVSLKLKRLTVVGMNEIIPVTLDGLHLGGGQGDRSIVVLVFDPAPHEAGPQIDGILGAHQAICSVTTDS